jgi:hypothetical protein
VDGILQAVKRFLPLILAVVAGMLLLVVATLVVGVAAAVPIPVAYFRALRDYPGLAPAILQLFLVVIPIVATMAILGLVFFRWIVRPTPARVAFCMLPAVGSLLMDAPALAAMVWPGQAMHILYLGLSTIAAICAVPLGIWLGARLAQRDGRGETPPTSSSPA